ncbi:MAG TPA: DMT family transporter [Allosphingosinicella sp.]|jgi:drug/metabolite transporter (DMT)-like permease
MRPAIPAATALPPLRHERAKGVAMRLAAITGFSVMAALIKLSFAHGVSTPEVMFYRSLFGLPPLLLWIGWHGRWNAWRTSRPGAQLARSVLGLGSMALGFSALALLPLAEASTISFAAPLFALALSAPLLGERVGAARWLAVAAGFSGVLIVVRPGGGDLPLLGILVALGAALGVALVTVTLRSMSRTESTQTTVLWFTLFSVAVTGALMPWFGRAHDGTTWLLLVALGLFGGVGQIGLTASLRFAPIATLAPIDYLQLLYAVLFGWLLFGTQPALTTWVGAALIIASVLSTIRRRQKPEEVQPTSVSEL